MLMHPYSNMVCTNLCTRNVYTNALTHMRVLHAHTHTHMNGTVQLPPSSRARTRAPVWLARSAPVTAGLPCPAAACSARLSSLTPPTALATLAAEQAC